MTDIALAVANLDAWLETMRVPGGYGGPVVHWWQNCLQYTGPGLDWRYEGIITGYLTLWQRTGQQQWLEKARRAGDDLVAGQLPNGNYHASSFELNPYAGGTPHEAAADLGLLRLAKALKKEGDQGWETYLLTAESNLNQYFLEQLWYEPGGYFRHSRYSLALVPNKVCTLIEALFEWAELRQLSDLIEKYAMPSLNAVLKLQRRGIDSLVGAIPQQNRSSLRQERFFPYYISRCIPVLLRAYEQTNNDIWIHSGLSAMHFVWQSITLEGLFPQVIYEKGQNAFPQWIASLGDILRAADMLSGYDQTLCSSSEKYQALLNILLAGQLPSGGIATGYGFAAQVNQNPEKYKLDFRDVVPVVGWCDKAFRYFAEKLTPQPSLPPSTTTSFVTDCHVRNKKAMWSEDDSSMTLRASGRCLYHWEKGADWAGVSTSEVMWK